jgi:hypothetical protein
MDAVLTISHRLPASKLRPFFWSLSSSGFTGILVVFSSFSKIPAPHSTYSYDLNIRKFRFFARHVKQPLARFFNLFKFSEPYLPKRIKYFLFSNTLHLFFLRHLLYLRFLETNPQIERVLMCDCRDVFFQRNPFSEWVGNGLQAYAEDEKILIGDCPHHKRWIKSLAGEETFSKLSFFPRICAGTIMADRESAITMLRTMMQMTIDCRSLEAFDGDQGLYNILVYERRLPGIRILSNGAGSVFTASDSLENFYINHEGWISRDDGHIVPIIHQYDRSPFLESSLLSKIGLSPEI